MVVVSTPLLGRGGVMARASRGPRPCWRNAGSSRSFHREQDHVIVRASRHELETPKPNHCGAWNRRSKSGHLEKNGKSIKNTQDPYLARQLSVFSPRGVTPTSKFVCVLPFPDGDARKDTKIYPGLGKRRPYVQRGRRVCIISHLSACTGVNTSVCELGLSMEALLRVSVVSHDPVSLPGPPLL